MQHLPRRDFIGGLAALGASSLIPGGWSAAQTTATAPHRINVHHHLTAPAYVKFLTENKVRDFPNKTAAEGLEDIDRGGIGTAFPTSIRPALWAGNLPD